MARELVGDWAVGSSGSVWCHGCFVEVVLWVENIVLKYRGENLLIFYSYRVFFAVDNWCCISR